MNKIEIKPMLGYESKLLNRDSKQLTIGKIQYQAYPQVKGGQIVKGKYIVQLNYNGSMKQGGMKRNVDGIKEKLPGEIGEINAAMNPTMVMGVTAGAARTLAMMLMGLM